MKNFVKVLALGVFAASTTLVAHATTAAAGSIQFSDNCGTGCNVVVAANGSGYLQFVAPGTVTGNTGSVNGVDTFTYFDGSPSGAVTFTNTNLSTGAIAPTPALGTQTDFAAPSAGMVTSPNQPGAPFGGALIASIDEKGELLQFYVTGEQTIFSTNSPTQFADLIGTGYFIESCDTAVCGSGDVNYGVAYGTFQLNAGNVGEFTVQGSATTTVTPEPSSLMLLGTGLASAAGMVFRRRRSVA